MFPCISVQFRGNPILLCAQCVVLGAIVVESCCFCCCQNIPCISATGFVHGGRSPCILAFTLYTLHFPPKNRFNWRFYLHNPKYFTTFAPESTLEGDMSLAKSVSRGAFYRVGSDILIAFIDALCLMYET